MNFAQKLANAALATVVIGCLIFVSWLSSVLPLHGGYDIPNQPPADVRRVHHPMGFSMIKPDHWICEVSGSRRFGQTPEISFRSTPKEYRKRRGAELWVRHLPATGVHLDQYQRTEFQGRPAFEQTVSIGEGLSRNKQRLIYRLLFQRDGKWFKVSYTIHAPCRQLPPIIDPFIASFRFDGA